MNSRLSDILLAVLVVMVGVAAMLQIQTNGRVEFLLQDIRASLQTQNMAFNPATMALPPAEYPPAEPSAPMTATPPVAAGPQPSEAPDQDTPATATATEYPTPTPVAEPAATTPPTPATPPSPTPTPTPDTVTTSPTVPDPPTAPTPAAPVDPVDPVWQRVGPAMTTIIKHLLAGEYDPVMQRFDPTMAAALTREQLAVVMDGTRARTGVLNKITDHQRIASGLPADHAAYQVYAKTANGNILMFTITLDAQDRIAGLFVKEPR
jgi:outer membrane biosynthesis protein TonB